MMDLQRIAKAEVVPDLRLRLTFADGYQGTADLAPLVARGGAFTVIAADPSGFTVTPDGRAVAWRDADGDDVDLCADALRLMAEEQRAAA